MEFFTALIVGVSLLASFGCGYAYGVLRSAQILARHKNKKG